MRLREVKSASKCHSRSLNGSLVLRYLTALYLSQAPRRPPPQVWRVSQSRKHCGRSSLLFSGSPVLGGRQHDATERAPEDPLLRSGQTPLPRPSVPGLRTPLNLVMSWVPPEFQTLALCTCPVPLTPSLAFTLQSGPHAIGVCLLWARQRFPSSQS